MNIEWNRSSMTRFAGEALFVSGCLSYDAACANEASASTAHHSAEAEPASSGGSVKTLTVICSRGYEFVEQASCLLSVDFLQAGSLFHSELAFSFFDCPPAPQRPQISVLPDVSDLSDSSDYRFIAEVARDFRGWITVTAFSVIRNAARAFRRVVCEAKALFNRRVFFFAGGLRL